MNPSNDNPLKNDQVPMENMNLDPLHDAFKKHFDYYIKYAFFPSGFHPSSQDHCASGLHQLSSASPPYHRSSSDRSSCPRSPQDAGPLDHRKPGYPAALAPCSP